MLFNIYHIYATMLAIMDLVVPHNRAAVRPDLDSSQGIAVNVVSFYEASAIAKNINTALVAIINGITPVFKQKAEFEDIRGQLFMNNLTFFTLTDLMVGSLFEVIHTPAKLFA